MAVGFDIWNDEGGFIYPDEPFLELVDVFDALLDQKDTGRVSLRSYLVALEELINRQPDFIDAHAHLGFALLDQGKTRKALDACLRGIAVGEAVIPREFRGAVKWGYLENRPFLRALHGAVLCQLRLRRRDEAVRLMERMLAYNPDDNQGMRYLLGSEYLRLGRRDKARPLFEAEAASYPPYHYELALLHIETGDWTAAATSLRRGFCANGYIAGTPRRLVRGIGDTEDRTYGGQPLALFNAHHDSHGFMPIHTPNRAAPFGGLDGSGPRPRRRSRPMAPRRSALGRPRGKPAAASP